MEFPTVAKKTGAAKIDMPLSQLQAALGKIDPAVPPASCHLPILQNVRFESLAAGLSLTVSDLDLSMRVTLPGVTGPHTPFLISTERLMSYAKLLRGDSVSLSPGDRRATLKCNSTDGRVRTVTQLPLSALANYPATPFSDAAGGLEIPQSVLLRMVDYVAFAISKDGGKHVLDAALLEAEGNKMRLVATDGHRLACYTVSVDQPTRFLPVLLPSALLKALGKVLDETQDRNVVIADEEPNLSLLIRQPMPLHMTHRKLTGQFPNYRAVMPAAFEAVVTVDAAEMMLSLQRCVAMIDRETQCVVLTVSPTLIQMRAVDKSAGETEEEAEAKSKDNFKPFRIAFKGSYMVEVLKRIEGTATLGFGKAGGLSPMHVSSEPATGERFEYVVMPMNLDGKGR